MKPFFIIISAFFLIYGAPHDSEAQKLRDVRPQIMPKRVVNAFREKHTDAFILNWKNSLVFPPHFVVNYTEKDLRYRERYRIDGLLLAKSRIYLRGQIPEKWESRARKEFPNRTVISAVRVVDMHDPKDKKTYWFVKLESMGEIQATVYNALGAKVKEENLGFIRDQLLEVDS